MRNITEIIIHCTATPAGRVVTAADVNAWHLERGFAGIGYHYLIRLDGMVETGRPLGRIGAHCRGHNQASIGVCYVGGIGADGRPADTRTSAQKAALVMLIAELRRRFGPLPVSGHSDYSSKACPCFSARSEYPVG